jgi:hypothetical protein
MRALICAAGFVLVACGSGSASTVVEIAPPAPLPQPTVTATVALQQQQARPLAACQAPSDLTGCTEMARLRVGRMQLSSPTCFVDAKVHEGDQGRLMKCASGAVAVFSRVSFAGPWGQTGIDTCLRTQFPFSDGCTWETMQIMRGGPSAIEYTYSERAIAGEQCAPSSCRARADVEVYEP